MRTGNFDLHMEAQRMMVNLCFAFDHVNYARYLTYQHVYLGKLQQDNHPAIEDLRVRGLGGSLSGSNFSTIHGDLITEVFNGQTKSQAGPHRSGYSTNTDAVDNWITTTHIHAKIRKKMNDQINLSTSSVHKETTVGAKRLHDAHVQALVAKLANYGTDPFKGEARDISTGKEIDGAIFDDISKAADLGNSKFKEFVQTRLVRHEVDFFSPIKKNNLQTGLKKKKPKSKEVSILKEDRQAFGLLLGKEADLHESFQYPITTYPLSIASADGNLKQGQKSLLRNFLITEADAVSEYAPPSSR